MKVTLEMTADVVQWRGVDYTVWTGKTAGGSPVKAFIKKIWCDENTLQAQRNYQNEMMLTSPGTPHPRGIPSNDPPIL